MNRPMNRGLNLSNTPECTRCGVCCFSESDTYLTVAKVDYERLGSNGERLTHQVAGQRYMKMSEGHCAALVYHPKTKEFLCSVYQQRPDVCHWLERGSGQCSIEREEKTERTLYFVRRSREGESLVLNRDN